MKQHCGFRIVVLAFFLATTVAAQIGHAPSGSTPTTPSRPPQANTPPDNTSDVPDTRPMYVSGKVMLEDGTSPSDPVTIQLLCGGTPRNVGYTNLKGEFSVNLSDRNNNLRFGDASQGGTGNDTSFGNIQANTPSNSSPTAQPHPVGNANYMGCELYAVLAGFRSDHVNLGNRRSLDSPEVGTVVLHRFGNVEGLTVSATTAMAPKDARKAYEKGRNAEKKEKWDEAEIEFRKAADAYPKFAAAWFELGYAQQKNNKIEAARESYARSLAADSKFINPYGQLALLAVREEKWEELADQTSRLLKLNPIDFPLDWYFNALANFQLQKLDVAEKSAREGINLDRTHQIPRLNHLLAVILARKHDYSGAAENLRAFLLTSPPANEADVAKKQLTQLEKLAPPEPAKQ
jgi:hypothetical protein